MSFDVPKLGLPNARNAGWNTFYQMRGWCLGDQTGLHNSFWLSGLTTPCAAVKFELPRHKEPAFTNAEILGLGGESRPHTDA